MTTGPDFIEIYDEALAVDDCSRIVARMRDSAQLQPGRVQASRR